MSVQTQPIRPVYAEALPTQVKFRIRSIIFPREPDPTNPYTIAEAILVADPDNPNIHRRQRDYVISVVGDVPHARKGWGYEAVGSWEHTQKHGWQLRVEAVRAGEIATVDAIREFLGDIPGVGPVITNRIVWAWQLDTPKMLDSEEALHNLTTIGVRKVDAKRVKEGWDRRRQVWAIEKLFEAADIRDPNRSALLKMYPDPITFKQDILADPYLPSREIDSLSFEQNDRLALVCGLLPHDVARIGAGMQYTAAKAGKQGHCYTALPEVLKAASTLLHLLDLPERWSTAGLQTHPMILRAIHIDELNNAWPRYYWDAEHAIANRIRALTLTDPLLTPEAVGLAWAKVQLEDEKKSVTRKHSSEQMKAILEIPTRQVSVLTGGAGTGKTSTLKSLLDVLTAAEVDVYFMAPTAKAARRIAEATGYRDCTTIHRRIGIGFGGSGNRAKYDEHNPLPRGVYVVDEASMLGVMLLSKLLRAVEAGSQLVLVGDINQLPPVEAGAAFSDLIGSATVPVYRLTKVFRQDGDLLQFAYAILNQDAKALKFVNDVDRPWLRIQTPNVQVVEIRDPDRIKEYVRKGVQQYREQDKLDTLKVLGYSWKNAAGIDDLNSVIFRELYGEPSATNHDGFRIGEQWYMPNELCVWRHNTNEDALPLVNGQEFVINRFVADEEEIAKGKEKITKGQVHIRTQDENGDEVEYDFPLTDWDGKKARATSVHTYQGSQIADVVGVIRAQDRVSLRWLYTLVTRASGSIRLVIDNAERLFRLQDFDSRRRTRLRDKLRDALVKKD